MEDVQQAVADGSGQDVVLAATGARTDPTQGQEHGQGGSHTEEILNLGRDFIHVIRMERMFPNTGFGFCFHFLVSTEGLKVLVGPNREEHPSINK